MKFEENYPLAHLSAAAYNPREIDEAARERLAESIRALGIIKPLIVTRPGIIVAGHQRTSALRSLGCTHCPAIVLPEVGLTDEIRFNQLHNGSDSEFIDTPLSAPASRDCGWKVIDSALIAGPSICGQSGRKNEILRLLTRYGAWGSCVAAQSGEILVSGLYAIACRTVGIPLLVHYVPDSAKASVIQYFGQPYGRFSYGHLPKMTWAQTLAQKMRLRNDEAGKGKSRTYERMVIPWLRRHPEARVLDFGAGQMDYVRRLKKQGYHIRGIEFYLRSGGKIDTESVHRDIDRLCEDLRGNGLYDAVVCDSVLNSVDSAQAERDVLLALAALCKPGGTVICSGISRRFIEKMESSYDVQTDAQRRNVYFIDDDGISALFAGGVWRYQKYHYAADVRQMIAAYFAGDYELRDNDGKDCREKEFSGSGWAFKAANDKSHSPEDYLPALCREFDLPLPDGSSYNRGHDIESAVISTR